MLEIAVFPDLSRWTCEETNVGFDGIESGFGEGETSARNALNWKVFDGGEVTEVRG